MLARSSKRAVLALLGLVLVVGVVLVSVARYFEGVEQQRRLQDEKASLKEREDFVFTVEPRTVERERRYAVAVDPWMVSDVPAEVAGRVSETMVEPGSRVKKGDPLVLLDDEIAASDLRRAEAQSAELQRLLAEAETLGRSKVVSRTQVEAVRSEARVADAAEDAARARFEDHTIRAPYNGDVVERYVQVGEAVNLNQRVVRMVDTSRLRVVFYVNERDIASFAPGTEISIRLPAVPGKILDAPVVHVAPASDEDTRLFRVEAELANPDLSLRGGLSGEASARVGFYRDQLFVPTSCVRLEGNKAYVLRIPPGEGGGPRQTEVRVGDELDGFYPVLEGLSAGDRLLVR
ncbi:MAG: efflux RND transporter periplasmic adaptor subunit [Chthoniobacterales bacterium]|jgi:membrane fusion protein (multidrug efflux system)